MCSIEGEKRAEPVDTVVSLTQRQDRAQYGDNVASSADCIIIGGGVIGLSIARRLAKENLRVSLLDRQRCGGEASWAGAGVIAAPNPHRNDVVATLLRRALITYPDFCAELQDETGIDMEYDRCGELELLFDENAVSIARSQERVARSRKTANGRRPFVVHSPAETIRIEPAAGADMLGSLECRETAQVRNPRLLDALRIACVNTGVVLREGCPVEGLVTDGDRVTGVTTSDGVFSADRIILCAGAWSSQIDQRLSQTTPVHPVRGQMVLMKLDERMFGRVISHGKTYLVPRRDGHVLLGSTEEPEAGFDKRNTSKGVSGLIEKAVRYVPLLAEATVVAIWCGLRPGTPDRRPFIGPVPGMMGLLAATGHFRSGLALAPVMAEAITAMILNQAFDIDLTHCAPGRSPRDEPVEAAGLNAC